MPKIKIHSRINSHTSRAEILSWPRPGPDRELQIRDETQVLAGARSGYTGFDRAVIGGWSGHVSSPVRAISGDRCTGC